MSDIKKLNRFSLQHYRYINNLFGNEQIRNIIKDTKSFQTKHNKNLIFEAESSDDFSGDMHHVLYKKLSNGKKKLVFCSVRTHPIQDIGKHPNDTLCQSYTLLYYINPRAGIYADQFDDKTIIKRQMNIIKMYRKMIDNKEFSEKMTVFFDSFYIPKVEKIKEISGKWINIKKQIIKVLDDWEDYGYSYFMHNGDRIIPKTN